MDFVYSSVPDKAFHCSTDPDDRLRVLDFLKSVAETPVTARKIAQSVELPTRGTQVEVRKIITELVCYNREPIVSVSKGFMYTLMPSRIRFYNESLYNRVQGIKRRMGALNVIARELESCQGRLR